MIIINVSTDVMLAEAAEASACQQVRRLISIRTSAYLSASAVRDTPITSCTSALGSSGEPCQVNESSCTLSSAISASQGSAVWPPVASREVGQHPHDVTCGAAQTSKVLQEAT